MKKTNLRILSFILALVILSLSMPVFANDDVDNGTMDTSGEYIEDLTPIPNDNLALEDISIGNNVGGEPSVELQDFTVITSTAVPDGVYALRNVGNGNLWISVQQNILSPGYHMQQYNFGSSPADTFTRAGLFKITRVGNTSRYTIRFMMNNCLSFCFGNNGKVITKTIPANDNEVALTDTFLLIYSSNGYYIQPYGLQNMVCANDTDASGAAGAPDSFLISSTSGASGEQAKWALEKYTGSSSQGCSAAASPNFSSGLSVGKSSTVTMYSWSTDPGVNTAYVEVPSDYSSIVKNTRISNNQITLTGKDAGYFRIRYHIRNNAGTTIASYYNEFRVVPDIDTSANYFIRNYGTKRYVDIEGPSVNEGAIIQQWEYSLSSQKRWILTPQTGGYFTIKSVYSDLYIGVDPSATTSVKQYSTVNDYTKWYFVETEYAHNDYVSYPTNYSIHCKALGDSYALATQSATSGNGSNLVMTTYTSDSNYRDEWNLFSQKYSANLYNFYDNGYNVFYTETEAESQAKIREYSLHVAERFLQEYGLALQVYNTQYFQSDIDSCKGTVTSLNIDMTCYHSIGSISHTKRDSVISDFSDVYPGNTTSTYAFWSGHKILSENGDINRSCSRGYNIFMLERQDDRTKSVLAHEMAHQYGASDHYHEVDPVTNECKNREICSECCEDEDAKRPSTCVMFSGGEYLLGWSDLTCSACTEEIMTHLESHHQ